MSIFFRDVEGDDNVFAFYASRWNYTSEAYSRMMYEHSIGFLANDIMNSRLFYIDNNIAKTTDYANSLIDDKLLRFKVKIKPYMGYSSNGGYVQPDMYLNGYSILCDTSNNTIKASGDIYLSSRVTESIYLTIRGTNNTPYTITFSPYDNEVAYGLVLVPEYGYYGN